MRLAGSFVALALALAACELPRPEGAYVPTDASVPTTVVEAGRADGGAVVVAPPPLLGGTMMGGMQGGMQGGVADGGAIVGGGPGGASDGGVTLPPEVQALKKLEGRYLMRMDMRSTASATASLITINTRNRISHLLVTQLAVGEDGQLRGAERLCYQTFAHECTRNCSLTTTMKPVMTDLFVARETVERTYTVKSGILNALPNTMALGYDVTAGNTSMPTREEARVWDPVVGGRREGLLLTLQLAAIKNVNCDVYTVQSFVSKFDGALAGSEDAPSLLSREGFNLDTSGGDGATLGASTTDCSGGEGAPPTSTSETVRFAAVAATEFTANDGLEFWSCPPQSAWDTRLAPPAP